MEGKEKLSIPKLHTFQKPTSCQKAKVDSVKVVVGEYYYVEMLGIAKMEGHFVSKI